MVSVSIVILLAGIIVDIISCYLNTKKISNHEGRSGIAGVSLVIYLLVFLWNDDLVFFAKYLDIIIFVAIHFSLQYGLPTLFSSLYKSK